ncbi:hypothetical protein DT075_13310 [Bacillus licheniformis]|nr:hypothetical protein DT075_13310 [Bacillus licheniformis]
MWLSVYSFGNFTSGYDGFGLLIKPPPVSFKCLLKNPKRGVAKKGSEGNMSNLAGISYDRAGKRRSTMLIMESLIGYVCFFTVNFIYDTYIKKAKAPFGHLAVISYFLSQ